MSIGVLDSDTCVVCREAQESNQHVFFACPFSSYLWSFCRLKLGLPGPIRSLLEEAGMLQSRFKKVKSTGRAKLSLAAIIWHIWKERNERIFQLKEQHKIFVFRKLYEDIRELLRTCN